MRVTAQVVGDNGDTSEQNRSGVAVLVDGKEITRVAFVRRFGANPEVDFKAQLDVEVDKAKTAVDKINELFAEAGSMQ